MLSATSQYTRRHLRGRETTTFFFLSFFFLFLSLSRRDPLRPAHAFDLAAALHCARALRPSPFSMRSAMVTDIGRLGWREERGGEAAGDGDDGGGEGER